MNRNPILQNYRSTLIYVIIWLYITFAQVLILQFFSDTPFDYAFFDTFVFNLLLACYLIPVWYPVRFNNWEYQSWRYILSAYMLLGCMTISVWLVSGYFVMWIFNFENSLYIQFLQSSLWWKALEGILCYTLIILVYRLHAFVVQLREKTNNEIRLTQLLKDGELNLLKSQINPHFLFNSLNSVNAMILKNPEQAQKMLVALSDYLRYAVLSINRAYATLQEETENIERFLAIEKLRFEDKLVYEPHIDPDCLAEEIPTMLLQPLFENAIKHGVYESLEAVHIVTAISKNAKMLLIAISNNYDIKNPTKQKGLGTGLQNISARINLLYGVAAGLDTKAEAGKFTVRLSIPISCTKIA
jgi:sensor histidine kinase YesM